MINPELKLEVGQMVEMLGACSCNEVSRKTGLPTDTVAACLHLLAADGVLRCGATYVKNRGKPFSFVWWTHSWRKGSYYAIRTEQKPKHPGLFGKPRKPRILIVDRVRTFLQSNLGLDYTVDELREALGVTYGKAAEAVRKLSAEGVIESRKEVYGRGRPRMHWYAVTTDGVAVNGEDMTKVSFEDDDDAVEV